MALACTTVLESCQPPTLGRNQAGPLVVLSADATEADFLITICYTGPKLDVADLGVTVASKTRSPGFEDLEDPMVVLEASGPGVGAGDEGFDSYEGVLGTTLDVSLADDDAVFVDTKDRCLEERVVHMRAEGAFADGQTIEFDWTVYALMRYERHRRVTVRDPEFEIQIEEM